MWWFLPCLTLSDSCTTKYSMHLTDATDTSIAGNIPQINSLFLNVIAYLDGGKVLVILIISLVTYRQLAAN